MLANPFGFTSSQSRSCGKTKGGIAITFRTTVSYCIFDPVGASIEGVRGLRKEVTGPCDREFIGMTHKCMCKVHWQVEWVVHACRACSKQIRIWIWQGGDCGNVAARPT